VELYECFEVETEGGRSYLVQGLNAAHAAHIVETKYQDRVVDVSRKEYTHILLTQEQLNASTQAPDHQSTQAPNRSQNLTITPQEPEADGGESSSKEDV
jgi:hypothetical protein